MKRITFLISVILISTVVSAQKHTDTISAKKAGPVIKNLVNATPLSPFEDTIRLNKKEDNLLLIEIGDPKLAAKISDAMIINPKTKDTIDGEINKEKATITFEVDDFKSIKEEEDVLIVKVKSKKLQTIGRIFKRKKKTGQPVTVTTEPAESTIDYLALAKAMNLSLGLADLYPDAGNGICCDDIPNPCDTGQNEKRFNKNKIVYHANTNETYYYNSAGIPNLVDEKHEIKIRAGQSLSFEVRDVNPDAFEVKIVDTAIAYEVRVDTLLSSFLPGVGDNFFNSAGKEPSKQDTARAVLLIAYMNLKEFFLHLQYSCIYQFNANINRKVEAKKRVDQFLRTKLRVTDNIGLTQILVNSLDTLNSEKDKELFESLMALYKNLPATYYRMITQIPAVPRDKDKVQFKFSILARENTPYMSLVREKTVDAYIIKNFRIDVSSGLYYAFNFQNNKYAVRADSIVGKNAANTADSTLKSGNGIFSEDVGKGEFGFVSFIHFYRRTAPGFSWGGHIGAGVSLNDRVRPRYFSGLSFIFGRDNARIALNVGIVGGNVDKISDQYKKNADGTLKWIPSTETSVVTKTKFAVQPFVSISYNLPFRSKAKKTETVAPPEEKKTENKKDEEKKDDGKKDEVKKENTGIQQQSSKAKKEVTKKTYYKN